MALYQVIVKEKELRQDMYYKNQNILTYTIKYPKFLSMHFQVMLEKLNHYYRTRAMMYEKSNIVNLFQMAMAEYEYSVANNFPIRQFEAYVDYNVTYNKNCAISLYFDQYEYAGGAHGSTLRYSDSWNLQKSRKIELTDLFPNKNNVREYIVSDIIRQINNEIASGNQIYFENYSDLVKENFRTNHFYLTDQGVIIYFQQYDIAPYSSGIMEFLIPYSPLGAVQPRCVEIPL